MEEFDTAFLSMRRATGFDWLKPRNFRYQVITKLFESGAPDETIMSIAGHQSIHMSRHYSRIRLDAKKAVLDAIDPQAVKLNGGPAKHRTKPAVAGAPDGNGKGSGINVAALIANLKAKGLDADTILQIIAASQ